MVVEAPRSVSIKASVLFAGLRSGVAAGQNLPRTDASKLTPPILLKLPE